MLLWMESEEGGRMLSPLVGRRVNREVEEDGLDTGFPPCCAETFRCKSGVRRLSWVDVALVVGVS